MHNGSVRRPLVAALALAVSLAAAHTASASDVVYLEAGGIVAVQFESAPQTNGWTLTTQNPGYTGTGYIAWPGPDLFTSPGTHGVFGFQMEITTPGTYVLHLHNRHDHPSTAEENDVWVRMDNQIWQKVFSGAQPTVWNWEGRVDDGVTYPPARYTLTPGVHTVWFSGRSAHFMMDRMHVALEGHPAANDVNVPESTARLGTMYGGVPLNSSNRFGAIEAYGSPAAAHNDVTLHAYDLPAGTIGFFLVSDTPGLVHNPGGSVGNLLVVGGIGRYAGNLLVADASGRVSLPIDLASIPRPSGPVAVNAGETWYFQYWHRDSQGGSPTSNLTRGLELEFH